MSSDQIDVQVRDFYLQRTLSPDRAGELLRQIGDAPSAQGADDAPRRRRMRIVAGLAALSSAAAAAVLTLTGVFMVERSGGTLFGPASEASWEGPDIIAVQMTAEWCRPSQVLSPRVHELRDRYGSGQVLFVELDLTSDRTRAQAESLMSALGIADVWAEQQGRTGELLLVDARSRTVLKKLGQDDDVPAMAAALRTAIDGSPG